MLTATTQLLVLSSRLFAHGLPPRPRTFGSAHPNIAFSASKETELFSYNITDSSTSHGVINHWWSTACGGRDVDYATEGGISIYRFYIDGESTPSIVISPREASMIFFDPLTTGAASPPWAAGSQFGMTSDKDGFSVNSRFPSAKVLLSPRGFLRELKILMFIRLFEGWSCH